MEYLGAWGTLIHEKNLKSKISCQTLKEIKYTILYCAFVGTFVIPFHYGSGPVINYGSGSNFLKFRF